MFRLGVAENKPDILAQYQAESTLDLSEQELDDVIKRLSVSTHKRRVATPDERKWRSNVLVQLNRCGVYATNGDWSQVNKYLLDKRIWGKLLYELSVKELKSLCTKLRVIADKKEVSDKKAVTNGYSLN